MKYLMLISLKVCAIEQDDAVICHREPFQFVLELMKYQSENISV